MITEINTYVVTARDVENIIAEYIRVKFKLSGKLTTKSVISCPTHRYEFDNITVTQENNFMNIKIDEAAVKETVDRKIEIGQL